MDLPESITDKPARARFSRRHLLGGAAGAVVAGGFGAATGGLGSSFAGTTTAPASAPTRDGQYPVVKNPAEPEFKTRPDLLPPKLQISVVQSDQSAGLILLTPSALPTNRGVAPAVQIAEGLGQPGVMIIKEHGNVVWFHPVNGLATNLQVQSYDGKPVLTYWEGAIDNGIGFGTGYILDSSYQQVATVKAGNGLQADLHELQLTPQNTALITAYTTRSANLTAIDGPSKGVVWDSVVQEIDVKTAKVLSEWHSLDHVPVTESYADRAASPAGEGLGTAASPFDYFHVNSVSLYGESELLVSARNTWALYRIDRRTGAVIARINGRKSDYKMGQAANFYWQHHSRLVSPGVLTVYDDGASPAEEPTSRGLVLSIDDSKMTVDLTRAYVHPARLLTPYEGSVQLYPDGRVFVGFGAQPYFTQFASDGAVMYNGRFPTNAQSYRAFRSPWTATPAAPPEVELQKDSLGQTIVHVSWNGATEVRTWQVLNGKSAATLTPIASVPEAGFETSITTRLADPLLAIAALDASGKRIGISATLRA